MARRARRSRDQGGFTLVELLVVMLLMGIVGATTTSVVISTLRTEQLQREMQAVMDDGRISLQRIRGEVRAARRVFATSCEPAVAACAPSSRLHFWVDQNQDAAQTPEEVICYLTEEIGTSGEQFQLVRWTEATAGTSGCDAGTRPSDVQVVARTLLANLDTDGVGGPDVAAPFVHFEPEPTANPSDDATRNIRVLLRLEVRSGRDYEPFEVETIVRLRNVA